MSMVDSSRRIARSMAELPNLPGYRPHQVGNFRMGGTAVRQAVKSVQA